MFRLIRALGAFVGLVAIMVGVPLILLLIGRFRGLLRLGSPASPDDGTLLIGILTLIAWLAWLVVVATIITEAISVATRGRIRIRLPGTGWLRPVIGLLIVAVAGLTATPLVQSGVVAQPMPRTPPESAPLIPQSDEVGTAVTQAAERHRVETGDDLWSLAERYYGAGSKWRVIADANPWLDPAARLTPDMVLIIPHIEGELQAVSIQPTPVVPTPSVSTGPSSAASGAAEPTTSASAAPEASTASPTPDSEDEPGETAPSVEQERPSQVVVQRGETLWQLAATHLGDPERWPEIYRLNADQIANPDEIDIGWTLALPAPTTALAAVASPTDTPIPAASQSKDEAPAAPVPALPAASSATTPSGTPSSIPAPSSASLNATRAQALPFTSADSSSQTDIDISAVATIGALLATGILGALSRERLRQLFTRGLGRRLPIAPLSARLVEKELVAQARLAADPPEAPAPTAVVIGWSPAGDAVLTDLEHSCCTTLTGDDEVVAGALAAISSSLACAEWSQGTEHTLVGSHESWTPIIDDPAMAAEPSTPAAIARMKSLVEARLLANHGRSLPALRAERDLAPSWQASAFLFCDSLSEAESAEVERLASSGVGVSAVLANPERPVGEVIDYPSASCVELAGVTASPQLLAAPARRALIELFRTAASLETTPAPWWSFDDDLPPNVTRLTRTTEREALPMADLTPASYRQPTLLILGPVQLVGTSGPVPTRSMRQCEEYCAWLLGHPGATPTQLSEALVIAEATRRSTLCRLRGWLGEATDGTPYLPDAYSGRISLHPDVTSDWELFGLATSGGVNRATNQSLVQALNHVRGMPLADTAPWQWVWAEELRTDMTSAVRDAGAVLTERALQTDDEPLARWALTKALLVAPDDELLLTSLVEVEHRYGSQDEVKRLVMRLTRASRETGIDLSERTVAVLHSVMSGGKRVRRG